ncbi:MAG TPA: nitrate/nitrite transporter NrtS [Ktedonobacterales bacterium]|nr:nitrate/nitrite transporter NrtS [Ktedonobacterales bacterium]
MAKSPAAAPSAGIRGIVAYCLERDTLVHSVRTALLVGTILALINHGADMLAGQLSARWVMPMLITYLVPFSVATYGQVHGKRQRDALRERATPSAL